jgi:hypothetical protein
LITLPLTFSVTIEYFINNKQCWLYKKYLGRTGPSLDKYICFHIGCMDTKHGTKMLILLLVSRCKGKLRVRAFENRVLRRIFGSEREEVTRSWRNLL